MKNILFDILTILKYSIKDEDLGPTGKTIYYICSTCCIICFGMGAIIINFILFRQRKQDKIYKSI